MASPNDSSHLKRPSIVDAPDSHDIQFLDDRLYEYNVARTGIDNGRPLAIFLRNLHNDIIAGLYGWTWAHRCEIKTLWVHEQLRGQGLGTRLMIAAEDEARARGAIEMVLSTYSFQAPDFYRRLGFEPVGYSEEYPVGYQNIFLRKQIK